MVSKYIRLQENLDSQRARFVVDYSLELEDYLKQKKGLILPEAVYFCDIFKSKRKSILYEVHLFSNGRSESYFSECNLEKSERLNLLKRYALSFCQEVQKSVSRLHRRKPKIVSTKVKSI